MMTEETIAFAERSEKHELSVFPTIRKKKRLEVGDVVEVDGEGGTADIVGIEEREVTEIPTNFLMYDTQVKPRVRDDARTECIRALREFILACVGLMRLLFTGYVGGRITV